MYKRVPSRVRFPRILLWALVASLCAFILPSAAAHDPEGLAPLSPPVPTTNGQWVEGHLQFPEPARVTSEVTFPYLWLLHWRGIPESVAIPSPSFLLEGPQLQARYYERTLSIGPVPAPATWQLTSGAFDEFHLQLAPEASPKELLVSGPRSSALHVNTLTEWQLSTQSPQPEPLDLAPDGGPFPPPEIGGWSLVLEGKDADFAADSTGHTKVYGFNATIRHADGLTSFRTGIWQESVAGLGALVTKEGVLILSYHSAKLEATTLNWPVRIVAPALTLTGTFDVPDLLGHLSDGASSTHEFQGDDLQLEASLLIFPTQRGPDAAGGHQVDVEGVAYDFAFDSRAHEAVPSFMAVLGIASVAGLLLAGLATFLWKPVASLFTRLRKDELLEQPSRRLVFDAIQANRGITMPDLVTLTGLERASLRHHLRILEVHGRIRSFKSEGQWRFVDAKQGVKLVAGRVPLEWEPKIASLLSRMGSSGANADELVSQLQTEWGLSRSGGWYVIERAVRAQLVTKEHQGRTVVLRPASPAPTGLTDA